MDIYHVRPGSVLFLGKQGENLARKIQFDISRWISTFGPGTVQLLHQRSGDEAPYPVAVEQEGNLVVWTVTSADTAVAGTGRAELQYYVGDALAKSETWMTKVLAALGPAGETPPEAQQGWVDQVLQAGAAAAEAAEKAVNAAVRQPIVGGNGNWWTWDLEAGAYVDTGIYSGGDAPYIGDNGNWYVGQTDTGVAATGPIGPIGVTGATGPEGPAGSDGKSAYQYAVEGGYTGTEEAFAAKLAEESPAVDDTLTQPGQAADAAAVGEQLSNLSEEIDYLKTGSTTISLSGWVYGYVSADGELVAGGTGCTSDYVEISAGHSYTIMYPPTISAVRFAIYDSERNFVSRIIDGTAVYNATADGYIRVTASDSNGSIDSSAFSDVYIAEKKTASSDAGNSSGGGADYSFLSGLKYYALGDSVVAMQGTAAEPLTFGDSGYSSDLQGRDITNITVDGYVSAIENRYGLAATNYGAAGHTLVQDYASLAAKDYSDVALVTISYGCNDARTNVPLGTVNSTDVTTFAGALNQLLRKIYTNNPECRVIVLTPIQRLYVSDFGIGTANSNGNYLIDFVDMCKKVAAKRSTKCIDMYRDCGINQTNLYFYTVEGVHPVNQGFARMKGAIIPVLDDMFALEYDPFGTMTNTGDTEPDEPDTGGDSGGNTPPEEEPGQHVVDLSGLFVLAGTYYDPWASFQSKTTLAGIEHPGVALEGGHTYTLITYLPCYADDTWAYGGALADNPSMNPTGGVTLSFGKSVGTFEVVTINGRYYGKCSYTFTIGAGETKYLYTARAADLDDSYVSLTYI